MMKKTNQSQHDHHDCHGACGDEKRAKGEELPKRETWQELAVTAEGLALRAETMTLMGLDCADCATKLEGAITRLEGVVSATLNYALARLNVSYDEGHISRQEIIKLIKGMGYGVEEELSLTEGLNFNLEGLDCADCAQKLETRLARMAGVDKARVNYASAKLYIEGSLPPEKIIKAVSEAGYQALLPGVKPRQKSGSFWLHNRRAFLTLISGFLLLGGVIFWTAGMETIAIPLFLGAIVVGGVYTVRAAFYSLKSGLAMDMNVLMTIAVAGAIGLGEWVEGATVVFLFSLGNSLEAFTMDKTRKSIGGLMDLAPQEALIEENGQERLIPVEELSLGDRVIIKPGASIPIDGQVIKGRSAVNQAPITGESVPVAKEAGDEVYAGTINENGLLIIQVNRLVADTTLARIISMVEEAQGQKAPAERFVDIFARYYTPIVILLAVLIVAVPTLLLGQEFSPWFYRAITLLVVACPCALVISTPVSIVSAIGNAARKGVLIKGGAHLEQAGKIRAVAFDKTGTLTWGEPVVTDIIPAPGLTSDEVLAKAGAVEKGSEHPLAGAVLREMEERQIAPPEATDFVSLTGRGIQGRINGQIHYVGSPRFFVRDLGLSLGEMADKILAFEAEGKTVIVVGLEQKILGFIACGDNLRESSRQAVDNLQKRGIKTVMLTGDNPRTAKALAEDLGLDDFRGGLLPEEKVDAIKELQEQYGSVAMVGDGINDAPALATADVGIAMGGAGTDTALETADIALIADDLSQLPFTIKLSRQALSIIRQNIGFALLVKVAAVALVFPGILNLWIAILADTGASLVVIANGMRLLRVK